MNAELNNEGKHYVIWCGANKRENDIQSFASETESRCWQQKLMREKKKKKEC